NTNDVSSITRTVRKDNTINFLSNRYSVPLGTYHKTEKVIIESTEDNILKIYEPKSGAIIAKHSVNNGRGNLIQARDHRRDRSKGIDAYIETVTLTLVIKQQRENTYERFANNGVNTLGISCS